MKVGTKSVIGGAHCFLLHPFFVAWGWARLFGFPRDVRLWFAFLSTTSDTLSAADMDGPSGEERPTWSAASGLALRTGMGGRMLATLAILEPRMGFRSADYAG